MIETQQKKMRMYKMEAEKATSQLNALKRNYEGVSKSAANDKAEFTRLQKERDQFQEEAQEHKERLKGIDEEIEQVTTERELSKSNSLIARGTQRTQEEPRR